MIDDLKLLGLVHELHSARPDTMLATLEHVRALYGGGAEHYLRHGVTRRHMQALCTRLVDDRRDRSALSQVIADGGHTHHVPLNAARAVARHHVRGVKVPIRLAVRRLSRAATMVNPEGLSRSTNHDVLVLSGMTAIAAEVASNPDGANKSLPLTEE